MYEVPVIDKTLTHLNDKSLSHEVLPLAESRAPPKVRRFD